MDVEDQHMICIQILRVISGIKFVVNKKDVRACNKLEIKYDKEVFNKGFYIRDLD